MPFSASAERKRAALLVARAHEAAVRVVHVDHREPHAHAAEEPRQLARLLRAGVEAGDQHPRQVHGAAAGGGVPAHGGRELRDAVARGDRHERLALLGEGRGQREDQPVRMALLGVALDLRQQADGRDRDAVAADARSARVAQDTRGPHHVVVVLERLALALEHDAGHGPFRRLAPHAQHLLDHLPGLEVAREAEPSRLAEAAGERAADLRGDADAEARLLERDAHGLEDAAVARAEQVLDERVDVAAPPVDDLQPLAAPALAQLARERLRQPRHGVELVPVLPDQAVHDAARHRQREPRERRDERLGRVAAEVGRLH